MGENTTLNMTYSFILFQERKRYQRNHLYAHFGFSCEQGSEKASYRPLGWWLQNKVFGSKMPNGVHLQP